MIADLLGSPLPSELIRASEVSDVRVAWRKWITMRVKIIDEYNRIPTKTQSALLSLMAEGYAEMFEQTIESGRLAWCAELKASMNAFRWASSIMPPWTLPRRRRDRT